MYANLVDDTVWDRGAAGSNPVIPIVCVAQLVEQWVVIPLVAGSNPVMHLN